MNSTLNNISTLNRKIAHKFYLFSIGFYVAIAGFFGSMYLLKELPQLLAVFIGYFIIVLARTFYDQLILYEVKSTQLSLKNNAVFSAASACVFVILYHFLKAPLGNWVTPVTIIIAMKVMAEIKKIIWPNRSTTTSEVLTLYTQKFQRYMQSLYGLLLIIALFTSQLTTLYGMKSFYFAFAASIFLGLLFEQIFCYITIYNIKLTTKGVLKLIALALLFAILCSGLVFILMQIMGMSGKTATIIGIITLKLIQPLVSYGTGE
ncbi:TPA: hypothetical protein DDZ86_01545 [Candidatus Dependentiae bacterium]|nr:MAG: hypothetical protein UW09_C0001G0327 [candidate division TM6 bacterium GW2011_GWF2_43_87]HBL98308.1 hypothetical protein [Candidatus Dependentiae bacterium]